MFALLLSLTVCAPPIAPAPAPAPQPHGELTDPFAPAPATHVRTGKVCSRDSELLAPFSAKYRNVRGPDRESVRSPFEA